MARTWPSGVIARPLVALVPTSMPKSTVMIGRWIAVSRRLSSCEMSAIQPPDPGRLGSNHQHADVSSQAVDVAIAAVAARQNGNITRPQLHDLGVGDGGIAWRVKIGRLHRVFRGVYSVGRPPITPHEWASAAVLACGPGAALSHGSAMALWGYWRRWDKPYEVTVVGDRRTPGIKVHRSTTLHRRDVTTHMGIRATSPARTVLDVSPRQTDRALKRMVNNALNSQWVTEEQLADTLGLHPTLPGATRIATLIGLDGFSRPARTGKTTFPPCCADHGVAGAGDGRADRRLSRGRSLSGRKSDRRARQLAVPQGQDRVRDRP